MMMLLMYSPWDLKTQYVWVAFFCPLLHLSSKDMFAFSLLVLPCTIIHPYLSKATSLSEYWVRFHWKLLFRNSHQPYSCLAVLPGTGGERYKHQIGQDNTLHSSCWCWHNKKMTLSWIQLLFNWLWCEPMRNQARLNIRSSFVHKQEKGTNRIRMFKTMIVYLTHIALNFAKFSNLNPILFMWHLNVLSNKCSIDIWDIKWFLLWCPYRLFKPPPHRSNRIYIP